MTRLIHIAKKYAPKNAAASWMSGAKTPKSGITHAPFHVGGIIAQARRKRGNMTQEEEVWAKRTQATSRHEQVEAFKHEMRLAERPEAEQAIPSIYPSYAPPKPLDCLE